MVKVSLLDSSGCDLVNRFGDIFGDFKRTLANRRQFSIVTERVLVSYDWTRSMLDLILKKNLIVSLFSAETGVFGEIVPGNMNKKHWPDFTISLISLFSLKYL